MLKENAANGLISLDLFHLLFKKLRDKLLLFLLNLGFKKKKDVYATSFFATKFFRDYFDLDIFYFGLSLG